MNNKSKLLFYAHFFAKAFALYECDTTPNINITHNVYSILLNYISCLYFFVNYLDRYVAISLHCTRLYLTTKWSNISSYASKIVHPLWMFLPSQSDRQTVKCPNISQLVLAEIHIMRLLRLYLYFFFILFWPATIPTVQQMDSANCRM